MSEQTTTEAESIDGAASVLNDVLGHTDDIRDNASVMIYRWQHCTKARLAKKMPGCFSGKADMVWTRRLTDDECDQLMTNPYCMFDGTNARGEAAARWRK